MLIEIQTGNSAGRQLVLRPGESVTVGRIDHADVVIPDDPTLSPMHFALHCEGTTWRVRDLNSRFGTRLNGVPVSNLVVRAGDRILAGRTTFLVGTPGNQVVSGAPPEA